VFLAMGRDDQRKLRPAGRARICRSLVPHARGSFQSTHAQGASQEADLTQPSSANETSEGNAMTGENTIIAPSLEQLWQRSRAGARAGTGFRFQDAAAMAAAVYDLSFKGIPRCLRRSIANWSR